MRGRLFSIRGVTTAALARLGILILGLAFQVILAKIMLPQEFATFALGLAASVLFVSIASLGISRAIARFLPELIIKGDSIALRYAIARAISYRFVSILLVGAVCWFLLGLYPLSAENLHGPGRLALLLWYVALLLQIETEAVALALMEHDLWSMASLLEIVARTCATILIATKWSLGAADVILVWLATSAALSLGVSGLLVRRRHRYRTTNIVVEHQEMAGLSPRVQNAFALGIYVSSCAWLATSPAAIRLVSAAALPVVAFAAISFMQGLISSAQRGLPVHLLAPMLEPILVSKSATTGDARDGQRILSLVAKAETILVLLAIALITPVSSTLLGFIARPEFAVYGYIIPILLAQALGTSYYRVLEIVAGMALMHRTFAMVAPTGVVCLLLVFLTTPYLGLAAVLIWPSVELAVRLTIMLTALRSHGAARSLDMARLAPLMAATVVTLAAIEFVAMEMDFGTGTRFIASAVAGLGFTVLVLIIRPIRPEEYHLAATTFSGINAKFFGPLRALTR